MIFSTGARFFGTGVGIRAGDEEELASLNWREMEVPVRS